LVEKLRDLGEMRARSGREAGEKRARTFTNFDQGTIDFSRVVYRFFTPPLAGIGKLLALFCTSLQHWAAVSRRVVVVVIVVVYYYYSANSSRIEGQ
jgi:hypothetical protein